MDITLKVATLNFTGISYSPFEYHDGSSDKSQLDVIFLQLVKQNTQFNEESFAWDTGKIDVNIQRERYSPVYKAQMGIIRGKLINKQQFDLLWDHYFELAAHKLSKNPPTESNIARMRLFDWLAYLSLVKYSYGELDILRLKEYDAKIFQQKLKVWFSKAYLETKPKIDKVIEYINREKLSILFLQQADISNWEAYLPKGYKYKKRESSVIIYSSNFIDEVNTSFNEKYDELLNFNGDSVYIKSKDHLFISAHLTSKNTNIQQANQMYKVLDVILNEYPTLKIVVGMDANHFIRQHKNFNRFPSNKNGITTRKKRTYLQVQFNKANKLIEEVKDLIVTNLEITKGSIQSVDKKNLDAELIPNDGHPYDHFLVKGTAVIHIGKSSPKVIK